MFGKINNENVLCDAIYENGEHVPVYCNRVTGECCFADSVVSYNRLTLELSVGDPIKVNFPDTVEVIVSCSFRECLGIIYNGERLAKLLDDETAADIPMDKSFRASDTFAIGIYGGYDEERVIALMLPVVMLLLLSHRPALSEKQGTSFVGTDWSLMR